MLAAHGGSATANAEGQIDSTNDIAMILSMPDSISDTCNVARILCVEESRHGNRRLVTNFLNPCIWISTLSVIAI